MAETLKKINNKIQKEYGKYLKNFNHLITKFKNLTETNYNLALYHIDLGNITDAILRLKIVLKLNPEHIEAQYNLARCYIYEKKYEKAETLLYNILEKNPNHLEAQYLLATFKENIPFPNKIPYSIVKNYFDYSAEYYDQIYVSKNNISHELIVNKFNELYNNKNYKDKKAKILDLGAGTGTLGSAIRNYAPDIELIAIDCSNEMLKIAANKNNNQIVYNDFINQNFEVFLNYNKIKYDFIIANFSLIFYGDLEHIFDLLKKSLNSSGHIICTLYANDNDNDYIINQNKEYFMHSEKYIKNLIKSVNLKLMNIESAEMTKGVTSYLIDAKL